MDSFSKKANSIRCVRQLKNGSYLLTGFTEYSSSFSGWAAVVNGNGFKVWQQEYRYEPTTSAFLFDGNELNDGSIVFAGFTPESQSSPKSNDIWLLKVDANGCLIPGCNPTAVPAMQKDETISIYPNPAQTELTITGLSTNSQISITDVAGKTVYTDQASSSATVKVDVRSLTAGIYFVNIQNADGTSHTEKFVKE